MISSIVHEIQHWISLHQGKPPSQMRVPQGVIDDLVEEARQFGFTKDKKYEGKGLHICGIPVLVDPTLTIGKIDG